MLEIARYSGIDGLIFDTSLLNIDEICYGAAEIRTMTIET
jgi:hypothetical protein